jgi:hypothetical protein
MTFHPMTPPLKPLTEKNHAGQTSASQGFALRPSPGSSSKTLLHFLLSLGCDFHPSNHLQRILKE